MALSPLDYRGPDKPEPASRAPDASGLGVIALGMVTIPLIGFIMRNGAIYLCGGIFAPFFGMLLAGIGIAQGSGRGLCAFAFSVNVAVAAYFIWLIFVHGIC